MEAFIFSDNTFMKESKQLIFSSEAKILIKEHKKFASTKLTDDSNYLKNGMFFNAICGNEILPMILLNVKTCQLKSLSLARLALGSFTSTEEATVKLSAFFKSSVSSETTINHYIFLEENFFNQLPLAAQEFVLAGLANDPFKIECLKQSFLSCIKFWILEKRVKLTREQTESLDKELHLEPGEIHNIFSSV